MNDSSPATVTATDEPPTVEDYRSVSITAVLALLVGLASALALAHPLLAIVPLTAIVLSILALRSIAAAPHPVTGKGLAFVGLCLAALFLGWGLGRHSHRQAILGWQAREFADDWLRVLASGDRHRAHQLHVAREYRVDTQSDMPSIYQTNQTAASSYSSFFQSPALERILAAGPNVRYRFVDVTLRTKDQLADIVVLKYVVEDADEATPLWITVRRTFGNLYHDPDWEINAISGQPPSIN